MDPTEKGVWWKDDRQWKRFAPADAKRIIGAFRNGEPKLSLGPFKSPKHPAGVMYAIDLVSMKQTNADTGFSRDIKIIPGPEDDQEDDSSDEDFCGGISPGVQTAWPSKEAAERDTNVVTMIPSVTVDLQKLSTQCRVGDQCNLVLKLPKAIAAQSEVRLNSLMNKTMGLMVEKLSSKDFIKAVLRKKLPGWTWRVRHCNPYRLGRADECASYRAFFECLCGLANEEEAFVDGLLGVAEKGNTVQGDPVEYLFLNVTGGASDAKRILEGGFECCGTELLLSRDPPVKRDLKEESRVIVCVGISKFLQEKPLVFRRGSRVVTTRTGTVVPLALLADASYP